MLITRTIKNIMNNKQNPALSGIYGQNNIVKTLRIGDVIEFPKNMAVLSYKGSILVEVRINNKRDLLEMSSLRNLECKDQISSVQLMEVNSDYDRIKLLSEKRFRRTSLFTGFIPSRSTYAVKNGKLCEKVGYIKKFEILEII